MSPATDVTDPMSRHNLHVTRAEDLVDIGPWTADQLYRAVERADADGDVVVLDYGREQLSLAAAGDLTYLPPAALGVGEPPALRVDDPRRYDPDDGRVERTRVASVTVSPEFDILIPAFDWSEPDDNWDPPELTYEERPSDSPAGAVGG